jgi:hypothetical protein
MPQKEQEMLMKSIRKFAYAALLVLSGLSVVPTAASAQDAAGSFTLTHEVHWQEAIVPAGKYRFTITANGPAELLTLRKMSGNGAGFMLMVPEMEQSKPSGSSEIVVVARSGGSFVSEMQLPDSGITLHFAVPAETQEMPRTVASAATAP